MVKENEYLPVDVIILRTSQDNLCYIETKNLDGETNLKHKSAPSLETQGLSDLEFFRSFVECEQPSDKIYQF
jgi:magnesium-transporting ATPase (P-type)